MPELPEYCKKMKVEWDFTRSKGTCWSSNGPDAVGTEDEGSIQSIQELKNLGENNSLYYVEF